MRLCLGVLVAVFLLSCESTPSSVSHFKNIKSRAVGRWIDQEYAEYRAQLISDVHYHFQFDLTQKEYFSGVAVIEFKMASAQETTLDFYQGDVLSLKINGQKVSRIEYNSFFIQLPKNNLKTGVNSVEVQFKHSYSSTGSGLYRYEDPVDKNVYIYSDFEPYDANALAPLFDQPDIKATYQSIVTVPKTWSVITSTRETEVQSAAENKKWVFPRSEAFSTYVYSLHAGPYKVWQSEVKTSFQTIPLRLFARQTLAKYVDTNEWFSTTQQGFLFFEKYFNTAYPYKKYDQVIVPDFNSGAMENVAAVTFNEARYITRGQKQRLEKRTLAEVILHEMAHMWFGDLVTMKWWNDIWLNESFATYASYLALTSATPFKDSWVDFNSSEKRGAYREDQLLTTHPIEFEVANTDVVFANFDSITYGKGASVLKQLAFYIGPEVFQKGLQDYFKRYAGGNTTLMDFVGALEKSHGRELQSWKQKWLQVANTNTIQVDWACKDDTVIKAVLKQTAPQSHPVLRPHKTQVGVYGGPQKNQLLKLLDVTYDSATTELPELKGMTCSLISLIYPNVNDHDYVKVYLDEKSLQTAMARISRFEDELLRGSLWSSVWDLVVDQKLPATEYLKMVYNHSARETNTDILKSTVSNGFKVVRKYFPQETLWKDARNRLARDLTQLCFNAMVAAPSSDLQKFWFDSYVQSVEVEKDQIILVEFLKKPPAYLKFKIDQDRRWDILQALNRTNPSFAKSWIDIESKKDVSYEGQRAMLEVQAVTPDYDVKKQLWERVSRGPTVSAPVGQLRPIMVNLFPSTQEELHQKFKLSFFEKMKELKNQPPEYLRPFAEMVPAFCSTDSVNSIRSFVAQNKDLPLTVEKSLKINAEEDERCVGIRQKIRTAKAI